jgi:hypothetical protein
MTPLLTSTEMARRLGICTATLLLWRQRRGLREGLHYWQRGVGMERPRFVWDPEAVEQTLADPKAPRPRLQPPPAPSPMGDLVAYLLDRRHLLQDVVAVDCLALGQVVFGQPQRKVPSREVARAMGSMTHGCMANRLRRLRKAGLVDYEAGTFGDPGYQFLRIGPVQL